MFRQGQTPQEVSQMLVEEGATPAEAPDLARQYYRNFLLYHLEEQRKRSKDADMQKTIGAVLLGAGVVFNVLLYLLMDGETYVVFYGVLVGGLIWLMRGINAKSQAEANIDRLTKKFELAGKTLA
ncbi:hypothetical protein B0919_08915 [Hymenobacter sp. CRA2]|nr:hypothetical protein B0919_08915 [Hymenobacter sp. CRA2]